MSWLQVTDQEGRRILVRLDHVEAITEDEDAVRIVFRGSGEDRTFDWDQDGCLTITETFDQVVKALGGGA